MDAEKLKQVGFRAEELGKLKEQPGWQVLREIVEREETKYFTAQLKKLRRGEETDGLDVRAHSLAFDLVRYLLAHPEKAEDALKRALRKATSMEEGGDIV